MGFIDDFLEKYPNTDPLFIAIERLTLENDIAVFYDEYIDYLKQNGANEKVRANAKAVANENIGYVLGYYGGKTMKMWMDILPDVSHPIFGRYDSKISADDAFRAGVIRAEKGKKEAREYIKSKYG
jgi:1,4-dihydroxy-2-naphthoyl-CoA synthase